MVLLLSILIIVFIQFECRIIFLIIFSINELTPNATIFFVAVQNHTHASVIMQMLKKIRV